MRFLDTIFLLDLKRPQKKEEPKEISLLSNFWTNVFAYDFILSLSVPYESIAVLISVQSG